MRRRSNEDLRYEVEDRLPRPVALGLGLQLAAMGINSVVLMPTIVFRAGGAEELVFWAVFASVLACGVATILQGVRARRIGAGYALPHVSSAIFIAVCAEALIAGGPGLLATLVVISALAQAAFSARLSLLHRVLTPVVTGTVVMLLPVTVMPILFGMINELPPGAPLPAGPVSAIVTIVAVLAVALRTKGTLRLWAPAIGIVAGSVVGAAFGIYDTARVADAGWIGIPPGRPPVPDIGFGPAFWALLPAFLFVALVGTTKSVAVAVAAQRVSWRRPRAVDFRAVQRAVAAEGAGNLLAGFAGTMPNTLNVSGVAAIEVTGVAARRVGIAAGLVFSVLAFVPKALAVILAIPGAVVAASIAVIMATLFTVGMREVARSIDANPRNGLIAGVSFWTGVALEFDLVFPAYFAEFAGGLFSSGLTSGGLVALLLTGLTARRKRRLRGTLDMAELPRIREFIQAFSARHGLAEVRDRLEAASEEALLTLLESREAAKEAGAAEGTPDDARHELLLTASEDDDEAVLEFRVGAAAADSDDLNLQDRLAWLEADTRAADVEQEISLRLLRHLASSVRHQQFHDVDILTLRVSAVPERES
ncbi:uracil-xanthine permease family protein [Candidatus Palauibacter sp.]|uniref:uracil-xanthine permease family protein n=1 Tax=Candidatus Palauibacter sp. TaxID=3101350 RepID=UPI003B025B4E